MKMTYFDINILIYATIDQDKEKQILSKQLIKKALENSDFFISSLVLSEYIFTLSKLKIINECEKDIDIFSKSCKINFNKEDVIRAYNKCKLFDKCRNINDFIHLEIANRYCEKLVTFDSDFKHLEKFYDIEIEILK